jgi:hypothetical protein
MTYEVSGQIDQICNLTKEANGTLFTLNVTFPVSARLPVGLSVEFVIALPQQFSGNPEQTNAEFIHILKPFLQTMFSIGPPVIPDAWVLSTFWDVCRADNLRRALGHVRANIAAQVGNGSWPTPEQLFTESQLSFITVEGSRDRFETRSSPQAPAVQIALHHKGTRVGDIVIARRYDESNRQFQYGIVSVESASGPHYSCRSIW